MQGLADTYHKQLEAMKLAFADGKRYVADPRFMKVSAEQLLSETYAAKRRGLITDRRSTRTPANRTRVVPSISALPTATETWFLSYRAAIGTSARAS